MALRKQLAAQDELVPVLDLIPDTATDEQIYFYIWLQKESIASQVPIPANFNQKCIRILQNWLADEEESRDFKSILKLRPLAYKPVHFQELFKFAVNRANIFTPETIKKIEIMLDFTTPSILRYLLNELQTYPVYQQYALVVTYFLRIEGSFWNRKVFLNFISNGPAPPAAENETIRTRWGNWESSASRIAMPSLPTSITAPVKGPPGLHTTRPQRVARPVTHAGISINSTRRQTRIGIRTQKKRAATPNMHIRSGHTTCVLDKLNHKTMIPVIELETDRAVRHDREEDAEVSLSQSDNDEQVAIDRAVRHDREEDAEVILSQLDIDEETG